MRYEITATIAGRRFVVATVEAPEGEPPRVQLEARPEPPPGRTLGGRYRLRPSLSSVHETIRN